MVPEKGQRAQQCVVEEKAGEGTVILSLSVSPSLLTSYLVEGAHQNGVGGSQASQQDCKLGWELHSQDAQQPRNFILFSTI